MDKNISIAVGLGAIILALIVGVAIGQHTSVGCLFGHCVAVVK